MRARVAGRHADRIAEGLHRLRIAVTLAQRSPEGRVSRGIARPAPSRLAKDGARIRGAALPLQSKAQAEVGLELLRTQRQDAPERIGRFGRLALLEERGRQLQQCVGGLLRDLAHDMLGLLGAPLAAKHARQRRARVRVTGPKPDRRAQRRLGAGEVAGTLERQSKVHVGLGVVRAVAYSLTEGGGGLRIAAALEQNGAELRVRRRRVRRAIERLAKLVLGGLGAPLTAQRESQVEASLDVVGTPVERVPIRDFRVRETPAARACPGALDPGFEVFHSPRPAGAGRGLW
jgi:hypothetical protein